MTDLSKQESRPEGYKEVEDNLIMNYESICCIIEEQILSLKAAKNIADKHLGNLSDPNSDYFIKDKTSANKIIFDQVIVLNKVEDAAFKSLNCNDQIEAIRNEASSYSYKIDATEDS